MSDPDRQYRDLADLNPDAFIIQVEGKVVYCNQSARRMFHDGEIVRLIGIDAIQLVDPEFRAFVLKRRNRVLSTGEPAPYTETRHLRLDGTSFPSEMVVGQVTWGGRAGTMNIIHDITKRKQANEALRESEVRLSKAAEMAKIGHWVWDKIENQAIYCSEALAKMYGVASGVELAAVCTSHVADLAWVHPDDRERFDEAVRTANETKRGFDIEYRIINAAGEVRHLHNIEEPVLDEHGEIIRSNGITQDITERKRAEETLRESESRLSKAAEMAGIGYWVWDEVEDRALYCSDELAKMYGVTSGEELATMLSSHAANLEWVHPDDRERFDQAIRTAMETKRGYDIEYRIVNAAGEIRHLHEIDEPVLDERGKFIRSNGTAQDITVLKQTEEQFRQSQKLEALGQLAGGTAHEINNLLQPIITFAKLTRDEIEDPEHRHNLDRVLECGRRAKEIVADILTFARRTPGKPEAIEVRELMMATVRFVRDLIPSTIELRSEISTEFGQALLNRTEFTQVIINLAQNAADAIDRAGTITITTKIVDQEGHRAIQRHLSDGRYCRVSVKDTGSGMAAETLKRIFEPFFTTKPAGKGTGLGLSVVYGIVTGWGGSVSADSVVGEGSVFDVYIPLM